MLDGLADPVPATLGRHFVRFYRDETRLMDEVADFMDAGLRAGAPGIVIATPEHRAGIEVRLQGAGRAVGARRWYPGEYIAVDAREALNGFMVDGWPDELRFDDTVGQLIDLASRQGQRLVRCFGEMVVLLCQDGRHAAAIRLEELWSELGQRSSFALFCAYPLELFGDTMQEPTFDAICACHTHVLPSDLALADATVAQHDLTLAQLQQKAIALQAETQRREAVEHILRQNVTEQARAREVLERGDEERSRLLDRLRSASRAKDEFLAMLGHELRNPLAPIVTALQLMKMRGDTQTSKEQAIIQRQVDHLIRLVDDLLDISKVTRGKIQLHKESAQIADVLAKAVEMASMLLEQRQHHLEVQVPNEGLRWYGDPVRLAQVVANLLTNAARYTPNGGKVRLSAAREDTQLVIKVGDNGCGMAPNMLTRVFDLFVQGERGVDRAEGGLGIGLALVRSLVTMHGGTVWARSEGLGCGSEFIVQLPLDEVAADVAVPEQAPPMPQEERRRRVLVVDDNADAADMLGLALREQGHEVLVVHDPVAALESVEHFHPDVAVLDIGLPAIDGYELGTRLRARLHPHRCRMFALTGYGLESDRARSREAGFEAHLVKPVDIERLCALVVEQASLPAQ